MKIISLTVFAYLGDILRSSSDIGWKVSDVISRQTQAVHLIVSCQLVTRRFAWMYTDILKAWIRGIGIVAVLVGGLAFPFRIGINPERDTSIFHNFADLGLFAEFAFVPIGVGIVLIVISFLIPRRIGNKR